MKMDVYQGADGQFYWRLKAKNGRVIAIGGEGYKSRSGVLRALRILQPSTAGLLNLAMSRMFVREDSAK